MALLLSVFIAEAIKIYDKCFKFYTPKHKKLVFVLLSEHVQLDLLEIINLRLENRVDDISCVSYVKELLWGLLFPGPKGKSAPAFLEFFPSIHMNT